MTRSAPTVHPVDLHCGAKIRALRKIRGLSQQSLAEAGGVTFQQVQKYERGANRVSASMLVKFAAALGVSPGDILNDAPGALSNPHPASKEWDNARRIVGEVTGAYEVLKVIDTLPGEVRGELVNIVRFMGRPSTLAAE